MNATHFLFATGALALGLCTPSAAAQASNAQQAPVKAASASDAHMVSPPGTPALASKIIGSTIVDVAGKEIAEIKDLMVSDSGELVACVERSDDLLLCVPLSNLQAQLTRSGTPEAKAKEHAEAASSGETPDIKQFTLKGDRTLFDTAPTVKDAKLIDRACMTRSLDHFAGRKAAEPKTGADPAQPMPGHDDAMAMLPPTCVKALFGDDVKLTDGTDVGDVKDLAVNLGDSKIAYAIISVGGVLGMGDSLHAIAFDRLALTDGSVTIPMTRESLPALPKLELNRLPASPTGSVSMRTEAPTDRATDRRGN